MEVAAYAAEMTEMKPRYLIEIVSCLFIGVLPGCATAMDPGLPANGDAAQAGASASGSTISTGGADAMGGGGASTSGGAPDASSGASMGGTPAQDDGGASSSAGAGDAASGGANAVAGAAAGGALGSAGAAAGGTPAGGAMGMGGSAAGGAPSTPPTLGPWTFDSSVQGWAVRDHSATITTLPTSSAGVVAFSAVPFSAASQYTDFALSFSPTADLSGHTVHAKIRRVSGGFVGVQVYAYGGAWVGSTFTSLTSATFVDVALPVVASSGFDPAKITRIGIKFNTGSNATNTFSATTLEVDSVTIQ